MDKIEVYHASSVIVEKPLCGVGRQNLDFGPGFYMTNMYDQATMWALRRAGKMHTRAIVNIYILERKKIFRVANTLIFRRYNRDWLNFVVACRKGIPVWREYDYIEGGVADDRVIDTVDLYINKLIPERVALNRLRYVHPNNQICLLNQELLDRHLTYVDFTVAKKL